MGIKEQIIEQIREIVDRETRAWDTQDVKMLLSVFHKDMVWPWPVQSKDHDPLYWEMVLGRFDSRRWTEFYVDFFSKHHLAHNKREIKRISVSEQQDAAFAVVDIDTLWIDRNSGKANHWKGRTCKVYSLIGSEWKMTMHTGVLQY
ncbi:MAG: hypothetical protein JSW49_10025 [candidate division WOR-3 bacterium]|nr:MAG: hypothetical protein JSW49_10025 [candidate division WOR-3 bacterium]